MATKAKAKPQEDARHRKIFWTQEEFEQVAQATEKALTKTGTKKRGAYSSAVRIGQLSLPPERRRPETTSVLGKPWFQEIMRLLQKRMTAPDITPEPVQTLSQTAEIESRPIEDLIPESMPTPRIASALLDSLDHTFSIVVRDLAYRHAQIYAGALAHGIKEVLLKELGREDLANVAMHSAAHQVQNFRRMPKILIVGPQPAQQQILLKTFESQIDLRFVSSDESPTLVTQRSGDVDMTLLWSNFMSHAMQNNVPTNGNKRFVKGGIDAIKNELRAVLAANA